MARPDERGDAEAAWWAEYGEDYWSQFATLIGQGKTLEEAREEIKQWFNNPWEDEAIWTDFGPTKIAHITASFPPDHWTNRD